MADDRTVTASFTSGKVLTTTVYPEAAAGTVEYDPDHPGGTDEDGVRTEAYLSNTSVTLTAVPELGYAFDHWEQGKTGDSNHF
jgi:List-Bact-rpt repeat protein